MMKIFLAKEIQGPMSEHLYPVKQKAKRRETIQIYNRSLHDPMFFSGPSFDLTDTEATTLIIASKSGDILR